MEAGMPSLDSLSIVIILSVAALLTVLEIFFPDQKLPDTKYWWLRVLFLQGCVLFVVTVCVSSWQEKLQRFQLIHGLKYVSPFWGGVISYIIGTFLFYWWHRTRHEWPLFWRLFHQMHHSPSRVQTVTAFYVHPLEAVASSLLNAALVFIVLGLNKESLIWNSIFFALAGLFYHMNLPTPRWVGFFLQRPEMHRYHHKIGLHGMNYADLPIWDYLFGTYLNPRGFEGECGFGKNKELRFKEILFFHDINQEK